MTPNLSGLMNLAVMLDPKDHDPGHPKIHSFGLVESHGSLIQKSKQIGSYF